MARDPDLGWEAVPLQTGRRLRPVTPVHVRGDTWTCRRHRVKMQAVRGGQSSGRVLGGARAQAPTQMVGLGSAAAAYGAALPKPPVPSGAHSEPSGAGRGNSLF